MSLRAGQTLNQKYQIVSLLGEGGMGQVYKALQLPLGRTVALKVMNLSRLALGQPEEFRKRFLLEASLCAKLTHPNILTIYDYGRAEDDQETYFIAMEYLEGTTLDLRLAEKPLGLGVPEALRLATEIARGLREAHSKGIIHRDLKPSNIMLVPGEEGTEHVKILDFGLVKSMEDQEQALTRIGTFLGTPLYMPPEQTTPKKVDFRSDLYALGVILFECLTGALPYDGDTPVDILAEKKKPPPTLREKKSLLIVSEELQALVTKLLQPNPAARYQTCDELLLALRTLPEARSARSLYESQRSGQLLSSLSTTIHYRIGRQIASSPTAVIYEATIADQGRKVAVKLFIPAHEREKSRLQRDLPAMLSLQGPGLPTTMEVGTTLIQGVEHPYVVMDYIRGKTLKTLLQGEGLLSPARALSLLRQTLEGLAEIHAQGFVHRNLSPDHLMVSQTSANREVVMLISPGISAASDTKRSRSSHAQDALEQINRTAPEILQGGRRTESSDLYSVGVLLYECLAGKLPISDAQMTRSLTAGHLPSPTPLERVATGLSQGLIDFVARALQADPRARFLSASEMLFALEQLPEAGNPFLPKNRRSLVSSIATSQLRYWSKEAPSVWIFSSDPVFRKPSVAEAIQELRRRFDVSIFNQDQQENLLSNLEQDSLSLPWVLLFGDMDVILENPLLKHLGSVGEISRVLISTHSNPEMLRRSINFCGLDQSLCLPLSSDEIAESVTSMVDRSRSVRRHYDQLRGMLLQKDLPSVELFVDTFPSNQITKTRLPRKTRSCRPTPSLPRESSPSTAGGSSALLPSSSWRIPHDSTRGSPFSCTSRRPTPISSWIWRPGVARPDLACWSSERRTVSTTPPSGSTGRTCLPERPTRRPRSPRAHQDRQKRWISVDFR
jgi:serine/threonine protein kinase